MQHRITIGVGSAAFFCLSSRPRRLPHCILAGPVGDRSYRSYHSYRKSPHAYTVHSTLVAERWAAPPVVNRDDVRHQLRIH